ncbi:MAG: PAS domain S-box protein [candidate division KSB1 bacterium]|nr:PAS domain S-box protein [candidate division KSB1 bacterium]
MKAILNSSHQHLIGSSFNDFENSAMTLFQHSPIPAFIFRKIKDEFILVDFNTEACKITEGKIEALLGSSFSNLTKNLPEAQQEIERCFVHQSTVEICRNYRLLTTNQTRALATKYIYLPPDRVVIFSQDVTMIREMNKYLDDSRRWHQELFDLLPQTIFETDVDFKIVYANKAAFNIFGFDRSDLNSELSVFDLVIPEEHEKLKRNVYQLTHGLKTSGNEYIVVRKDGTRFPVCVYSIPIIRDGKVTGLRGILIDISPYKKVQDDLQQANLLLEQEVKKRTADLLETNRSLITEIEHHQYTQQMLSQSERKYRAIMEQSADCIFLIDMETRKLIEANRAFQQLLGYSADEIERIQIYDILASNPADFDDILYSIQEQKTISSRQQLFRHKNGKSVGVEISASLIDYDRQRIICVFARDITNRIRYEKIQRVIYQVSKSIAQNRNSQELFHSLRLSIGELLDTSNLYIALINADNIVYYPQCQNENGSSAQAAFDKILIEHIIHSGEPILINSESSLITGLFDKIEPNFLIAKSWLGVPLISDNQIIGAITVQNENSSNEYTKDDQELLELIANQIASGVVHLKAEEQLNLTHQIYKESIETAKGVPYRLNFDTNRYDIMSRKAEELLGIDFNQITLDRLKSMQQKIVVKNPNYADNPAEYSRAFRRGELNEYVSDFLIMTPKGELKWISDCAIPIRDQSTGKVIGSLGILQDITERKQAEQNLKEQELFIENILNSIGAHVAILNEEGVIVYVNKAWTDFAIANGLKANQVGENYLSVCDRAIGPGANEAAQVATNIRKVISGRLTSFSMQYAFQSGQQRRWFKMDVTRFRKPEPAFVVITHDDITHLKYVEEALQASEMRYRHIVEDQTDIICRHHPDGTVSFVNGACCRFLNKTPEQIIGQKELPVIHGEDLELIKNYAKSLSSKNPTIAFELRLIRHDGCIRWFHCSLRAIYDKQNNIREYQTVMRDITDKKKAEQELEKYRAYLEDLVRERTKALNISNQKLNRELIHRQKVESALRITKQRFELLYDENPSMYFTLDFKGKILSVNKFGAKQLGYAVNELLGKSVFIMIYKKDRPVVKQQINDLKINPKSILSWQLRKVRKDGSILWVKETARLVQDDQNRPMILIVCEDITEKINYQIEQQKLIKQLNEREKLAVLGQFTAAIAHEINNPLDIIMTQIDRLKEKYNSIDDFSIQAQKIESQVMRINRLIRNILSYATPKLITFLPVNINQLILRTIEMLQAYFKEGITIETKLCSDLPMVYADGVGLEIVLKNIIINAIESISQVGKVKIASRLAGDQVIISVKDTGIGIDKENMQNLFKHFHSNKKERGGTGLGLVISQEIIKKHQGHISVKSRVGYGTTFSITLPLSNK